MDACAERNGEKIRHKFFPVRIPRLEDWGQEEKGTTEDEMAGWHH